MLDAPIKYMIAFFADFSDVKPNAATIPPLLRAFDDKGFLPTTFNAINIGPSVGPPATEVRLRLATPNNEWVIDFEVARLTIEKNPIEFLGESMGSTQQFTQESLNFLGRVLEIHKKAGQRLSLVTEGLMREMSPGELDRAYEGLVTALPFYRDNNPNEWSIRSVGRREIAVGQSEKVNVICRVGRSQGKWRNMSGETEVDRIRLSFDINTYQGKTSPRFELSHAEQFLAEALRIQQQLITELNEVVQ